MPNPFWPTPIPAGPAASPSPFSGDYFSMLGIDPKDMRLQQISAILAGLGAGLGAGKNWGEGFALGGQAAHQNVRDARERAITEGVRGFQLKKYQDEQARLQAVEEATRGMKPPGTFDPAVFDLLPAEEKFDIWKTIMSREPEGPSSALAKLKADLDAGFITPEQYRAAARKATYIAPSAGSAPSEFDRLAAAAGYKPGTTEYQEAAKIRLGRGETQGSAWRERYDYAYGTLYKGEPAQERERKAAEYALGSRDMPGFTEYQPLPEDADDLEEGGYYTLADGTRARWNGTGFEVVE